jgi:hypothetical protein
MSCRLHRFTAFALAALSLQGCVQATRHSNTMIFATNTSFGLKAGTSTGQVPEVIVGYDRQEAVIMPLVANTGSDASHNQLTPCDLTQDVSVNGNARFAVHPCSLVATNGSAQDSYSVLASFGATYDAGGKGASGGLAQYFATGIAAQVLAAKGGAALVATTEAAKISAANDATDSIAALITGDPAFATGVGAANADKPVLALIESTVRQTSAANLGARLTAFESATGLSGGATACNGKQPDECANILDDRDVYAGPTLGAKRAAVLNAIASWATP